MNEARGVTAPLSEILLVVIVVTVSATLGAFVFDLPSRISQPAEPHVFSDTTVVLGPESRAWAGGRNASATRGEIDHIYVDFEGGEAFRGNGIGSIEVVWTNGTAGGHVVFLHPGRFDEETAQQDHGGTVGEFCTGDFEVGDTMRIRLVHNRWQEGGQTDPPPVRYVESGTNDIAVGQDDPFFRVENRYPIEYSGDRPIQPGDRVTVRFYGPEGKLLVAESPEARASVHSGQVTNISAPGC